MLDFLERLEPGSARLKNVDCDAVADRKLRRGDLLQQRLVVQIEGPGPGVRPSPGAVTWKGSRSSLCGLVR